MCSLDIMIAQEYTEVNTLECVLGEIPPSGTRNRVTTLLRRWLLETSATPSRWKAKIRMTSTILKNRGGGTEHLPIERES